MEKESKKKITSQKRKQSRRLRRLVQIVIFSIIAIIAINHSLEESGKSISWLSTASLHAVCPFGGVVSITQYLTDGTFVKKIHESSFILMFIVLILTVFLGPVFCGWICPMGSFQEWIGRLGHKLFKKRFNRLIPYKIDRILRFLRYGVLLLVLVQTIRTGVLMFSNIDPYFALFNFWTGEVAPQALIILGIVIVLSLFIERPFCKYACPFGALLGLSNLFRIFKIRRQEETCISCNSCDKTCPMNIPISNKKTIYNHQCISCLKCTSELACPVPATVQLSAGKKTGIVKSLHLAIIIPIVFIGGIGLSMAFNLWNTETSKVPARFAEGEFHGQFDPSDIRGSYTLGDISESFGISLETLAQAFDIETEEELADFKVKTFEDTFPATSDGGEIGTDSIRFFVANFLGVPFTPEETTRIPASAATLLKDKMSEAEWENLQKITVSHEEMQLILSSENTSIEESSMEDAESLAEIYDEEGESTMLEIKGNTTFSDLQAWGISTEQIEEVLEQPMGSPSDSLRDFLAEEGKEFSEYKIKFQEILNRGI